MGITRSHVMGGVVITSFLAAVALAIIAMTPSSSVGPAPALAIAGPVARVLNIHSRVSQRLKHHARTAAAPFVAKKHLEKSDDFSDEEMAEEFADIDSDSDGVLSLEEVKSSAEGEMPDEVIDDLFATMDADTSGGIDLDEFTAASQNDEMIQAIGIKAMMAVLDTDDDGCLSVDEFLPLVDPDGEMPEDVASIVFGLFDADSSDCLSTDELMSPPEEPSPEELIDQDKDGLITADEMYHMMLIAADDDPEDAEAMPSLQMVEMLVILHDADGDGALSYEEYASIDKEDADADE